jgi:hypothetical protein
MALTSIVIGNPSLRAWIPAAGSDPKGAIFRGAKTMPHDIMLILLDIYLKNLYDLPKRGAKFPTGEEVDPAPGRDHS